jgi:FixJ family two-component response regulator
MTEIERRKIAIADDDLAVRDSLRFLLEVVGHSVETFGSAAEFRSADMRHLSCLIVDQHMPDMTGLELAEDLRADGADIPIMLLTDRQAPRLCVHKKVLIVGPRLRAYGAGLIGMQHAGLRGGSWFCWLGPRIT